MKTNGFIFNLYKSIFSTFASFLCCFLLISYLNHTQRSLSSFGTKGKTSKDVDRSDPPAHGHVLSLGTVQAPNTVDSDSYIVGKNFSESPEKSSSPCNVDEERLQRKQITKKCNMYEGRWVYNEEARPMYESFQCPHLSNQVTCRKNGRPNLDYEKWRWEARDCEIPRFNGTDMLERMRGKRIIIVGDSLNRNQWESLSCLLYSAIPSKRAYVDVERADYKVFTAMDYQCTVEFFWSPFLVELDESKPKPGRLLKLDTLPSSSKNWRGADIMVFDTGHWWTHNGKEQSWDLLQYNGRLMKNLTSDRALKRALKTWGHWIDANIDPAKTTVFFRSISPEHSGNHWCYNKTEPIKDESFIGSFPKAIIETIERSFRKIKTPIRYLNITKLSEYRKDAHPTVYTTKQGKLLTKEQRKQPLQFADCSHWCLPGLPDTWNQLLYTSIVLEKYLNRSPHLIPQ